MAHKDKQTHWDDDSGTVPESKGDAGWQLNVMLRKYHAQREHTVLISKTGTEVLTE